MVAAMQRAPVRARFNHSFSGAAQSGVAGASFALDVDLALPGKGITAVFGESGSGKTTLLRCMAGLEPGVVGTLNVSGEVWQDGGRFVPTHERQLGYVFQESSLLPHLTAQENLHYGMRRSKNGKMAAQYEHIVSLMGIERLLSRLPHRLSGGERQRVAIARALLIGPRLLLMDEPLASLDTARRQEILPYLEKLQEEFDIPIVYVTHSVDEVARLADHLVVLEQGRVVASGSLTEVLSDVDLPIRFGEDTGVVLDATVTERDSNWHLVRTEFDGGELWVRDSGDAIGRRIRIRVLARDVSLALDFHDDSSIINRLQAQVVQLHDDYDDATQLVKLLVGSTVIIARISRRSAHRLGIRAGNQLWAQIKSVAILRQGPAP